MCAVVYLLCCSGAAARCYRPCLSRLCVVQEILVRASLRTCIYLKVHVRVRSIPIEFIRFGDIWVSEPVVLQVQLWPPACKAARVARTIVSVVAAVAICVQSHLRCMFV